MSYSCRKCNSAKVKLEERGTQTALLCADCGAWLKWVGKKEIQQVKAYIENSEHNIKEECDTYKQLESLVDLVLECTENFGKEVVLQELARMNTESRIDTIPKLVYSFEMM